MASIFYKYLCMGKADDKMKVLKRKVPSFFLWKVSFYSLQDVF